MQKSAEGHSGRGNDKYQGVPPPQVEGCGSSAGGGVGAVEYDQKPKRVRQTLGAGGAPVGVLASTG